MDTQSEWSNRERLAQFLESLTDEEYASLRRYVEERRVREHAEQYVVDHARSQIRTALSGVQRELTKVVRELVKDYEPRF